MSMDGKALAGITVVDLTQYIAGPYCTKLMAGFGADVIKIEQPQTGDGLRRSGPFYKDREGTETSIPFLWLNTGKKSVTLNVESARGQDLLRRLVMKADVLVENFKPGVMERLGLGYETLRESTPGLVMTSLSNFGQTGPYRDYEACEIELNALSGVMYMTGSADREPLAAGPALCQYTAGQHAYIATLMALLQRLRGGAGQRVDVSLQESALEHIEITQSYQLQRGMKGKRGAHLFVPWNTYECRDGFATVIAMPYRHWRRAADLFDDERLFDAPFDRLEARRERRTEYEDMLKACVKDYRKRELFHAGQQRGLAFGYVAELEEVVASPQHEAREFFVTIDHPAVGSHRYCGAPFKMSRTPWVSSRAPLLGEHNHLVYGERLGCSPEDLQQLSEEGVI